MPLVDWELTLGGRDLPLKVAKMIDRKKCKKKKTTKNANVKKKILAAGDEISQLYLFKINISYYIYFI